MINFSIKESLNSLKLKNYDSTINKNIDYLNNYDDYQLKIIANSEGLKLNNIIRLNFIDNVGFRCYNLQQERYGRLPLCRSIEKFLNEKLNESFTGTENIIDFCKAELLGWYDCNTWEEFINNQELGDCQSIVKFVSDLGENNKLPIKWHFGEITVDEPYYSVQDEEYINIVTHHWVEINNDVCEFSKGSLKNHINWEDLYSISPEYTEYHQIR